jgi:four helix bundle protein
MNPVIAALALAPSESASVAPAVHVPRPSAGSEVAPRLDAEKLTVYAVALELQAMTPLLVPAHQRVLHDQLERASLSAVLNVAEGAGRHSRRDKRRHYAIARGSAMETAACIDVVRLRRLAPESVCDQARSLALRVIQMLSKLSDALAP